MARVGRRPGHADTRNEILTAARACFAEDGYDGTSLRAVARRSHVDPALVHHYFTDKAVLFIHTMHMPMDPRRVAETAMGDGPFSGERVVERFLAQWEQGPKPYTSFVTLAQAMCASTEVADAVREFLAERLPAHGLPVEGDALSRRRRSLVSSQLVGLAWTRYVVRMEPLASADRAEVAAWAGPTIDRYATGEIDPEDLG
ncbi:MAG TPA: TetR family transcriptional regulator [Acidimicrobiales bacterium]|nr:TetR family transcriptional regulator [Acidimicrobiales bacterium]